MTLQSTDYAALAQDSYNDPALFKKVPIGGVDYKPIAFENDPKTGFQATAYEHINTNGSHEVVIAYRGTEFGREPCQDGLTDAGMALAGVNAQTAQSETFTQRALTLAEDRADKDHHSLLSVTVTGHSLGGTLAEINAYKFGLHGETFNAYGAAGLMQGVPSGGHQVIDHVKATDVVSAASPHFGEVRVYATQQDIDAIARGGYSNSPLLNALPTHEPILGKVQLDAHYMNNFVPDPKTHATILNPEDAQRAQANAAMIGSYRDDIEHARAVAALPGEAITLQTEAAIGAGIFAGEKIVQGAQATGQAAQQTYDYARDKTAQGVHATEHAAHQAYDYGHEKAVQGAQAVGQAAHDAADKTMQGVHAVGQDAQKLAHGASQEYTELATRLDRMLDAAKAGDWNSFYKDNKVFAEMAPGRELRAQAVATVNQQEQHATQLQAAQQQAQTQQQPQQVIQGPVMHR